MWATAIARSQLGDTAGALDDIRRVISIRTAMNGPTHEATLRASAEQALIFLNAADRDLAHRRDYLERSRVLYRQTLDEADRQNLPMPLARIAYGNVLRKMDLLDQALPQLLRANDEVTARLGPRHKRAVWARSSLASLYMQRREYDAAERQFVRVLTDARGEDVGHYRFPVNAFGALDSLGDIQRERGRSEQARAYWRQAAEMGRQTPAIGAAELARLEEKMAR
ncbi:tetratricopeptide repeat protein [Lysobacter firmicutimachus]|uniref:Tetratricopeptide repeat protein n=1 Tax=Lysobacter firmicutimachus TaxID=1792846 RepID=A0ABU8CYA5_9GAMM